MAPPDNKTWTDVFHKVRDRRDNGTGVYVARKRLRDGDPEVKLNHAEELHFLQQWLGATRQYRLIKWGQRAHLSSSDAAESLLHFRGMWDNMERCTGCAVLY